MAQLVGASHLAMGQSLMVASQAEAATLRGHLQEEAYRAYLEEETHRAAWVWAAGWAVDH